MDTSTETVRRLNLYRYRWTILLLFCLYSSINCVQFLQYTVIANIMRKYYGVDNFLMDMTGLVFMITFIVFFLPVNYLIEKYSLRATAILSSGLTAIGNLLKLLSANPDRFDVVIIAQTICGIGQVFMYSVPSKLASVWFGPDEVSTACAIALFGTQLGIAIGAILSPIIVQDSDKIDQIGDDIFTLMIYNAAVTCFMFLLVLLFFRARPPLPPSQSQIELLNNNQDGRIAILSTCWKLLKNKDFLYLILIFGIANGIWTATGVVANTIYLNYFPGDTTELGTITVISVIVGGCIETVIIGYILDKTHKFKLISFLSLFVSGLSYLIVIPSFEYRAQMATYFTYPLFAFFLAPTLVIGFEFATEVTYPLPEAMSCAILNAVIYTFGIIFTLVFELLFEQIGFLGTLFFICAILIAASFLVFFVSSNLNRRDANINYNLSE